MKQEQKQIKAFRIVNNNYSDPQELLIDSEKDLQKIRKEKSIKHLILTEKEFGELKKENSSKTEMQAKIAELNKKIGELESSEPSTGKPLDKMTKDELISYAEENGEEVDEAWTKKELVEYLTK